MQPKLLLFDIDGTLIRSGGRGKNAMLAAIEKVCGQRPEKFDFRDFAGGTDPLIIRTLIQKNGIHSVNWDTIYRDVLYHYRVFLQQELAVENAVTVLPGINALLAELENIDHVYCGLVTGNIEDGARLKLACAGLNGYFSFGAYGSDSENRNELPPLAVERALSMFDVNFLKTDVWVIGDTPKDIACAQANEFRSLAVATGGWGEDALAAHKPDVVLADMSAINNILQIFSITD